MGSLQRQGRTRCGEDDPEEAIVESIEIDELPPVAPIEEDIQSQMHGSTQIIREDSFSRSRLQDDEGFFVHDEDEMQL